VFLFVQAGACIEMTVTGMKQPFAKSFAAGCKIGERCYTRNIKSSGDSRLRQIRRSGSMFLGGDLSTGGKEAEVLFF
jgi:hypothetical protein